MITTSLNGDTIKANQTGAKYQWLDCTSGFVAIQGAINQSFAATKNGDYAVIITLNGCSDTSACVKINKIGIGYTNKNDNQVSVYPNPNDGSFTIEGIDKNAILRVFDPNGKQIEFVRNQNQILLTNASKGMYFLQLFNSEKYIGGRKIVVQ
jgi:hypothetical protein